jgi:POT family proton-dependent oligopeptide transporter
MQTQPKSASDRWPPQIKYIVGNEACERFSYYGMRSVLAVYITGAVLKGGLGQTVDDSTSIIHLFVFANYFMPLFGAWLSDKLIGRYHTILWVSLFYCAGHGVLACSDFAGGVHGKLRCLYLGLALIAFGSGGIKPCVSAFVGDQFKPEQSHLLQKAYGAFYWAINFGSFFSFLAIPWIKDHYNYSLAFAVPGILMALATFIFWLGTKHYFRVPPSRETKSAGFFKVFGHALTAKRAPGQSFWDAARSRFSEKEIDAAKSVLPILLVFALIPPFWSLFDQSNSTWVLQGEKMMPVVMDGEYLLGLFVAFALTFLVLAIRGSAAMTRFVLVAFAGLGAVCGLIAMFLILAWAFIAGGQSAGHFIEAGIFFVIAAGLLAAGMRGSERWIRALLGTSGLLLLIILIALRERFLTLSYTVGAEEMQSFNPLLVMVLVPLLTLGVYPRIGRFAAPLRRMSYGMFLGAASFLVVALIQSRLEAGAQLSVLWQMVPYLILTTAEVLISTTGLEFAFREAAPEMKSLIMSFWLLTVAFGDLLVVAITELLPGTGAAAHAASVSSNRFLLYAGLTFVVAILFSVVAAFYRYRDRAAAEGK